MSSSIARIALSLHGTNSYAHPMFFANTMCLLLGYVFVFTRCSSGRLFVLTPVHGGTWVYIEACMIDCIKYVGRYSSDILSSIMPSRQEAVRVATYGLILAASFVLVSKIFISFLFFKTYCYNSKKLVFCQ
ncbi:MAG: hypothetical protein QG629_136 [Patescibacteria group bacterium]|nr:hypothetical protein [Patescibacteria group bacterium]